MPEHQPRKPKPARAGAQQGNHAGRDGQSERYKGGGKGSGGGGQQQNRRTDEDRQRDLEQAFGTNYAEDILRENKPDPNAYIDQVRRFVEKRGRGLSTSQLRNIFTRVRRAKEPAALALLRPQLAYAAARVDKEDMRDLVFLLDSLIQHVKTAEQVKQFQSFLEAVVAYHKYFNPKES